MASRILPSFAQQAEIEAVMRNGWISSCRAPTATRCWLEARAQNVPFLEQHVAHAIDVFE